MNWFKKYLLIIINGKDDLPEKINFSIKNLEYSAKFENTKKYKYKDMINVGDIFSNIVENIFKSIIIKNENTTNIGYSGFADFGKKNDKNMYKSFFLSSQITSNGLYMLINNKERTLGKTAYVKISEIQKKYNDKNEKQEKILEFFKKNKYVYANYGNHKVYKVSRINFEKCPENTSINIKNENNKITTINLKDYFNKYYKITIKEKNQNLIEVENKIKNKKEDLKEIIYLIPELVRIVGPEDSERVYNVKNLITPNQKIYKIKDIYGYINSTKNKLCRTKNKKFKLKTPKEISDEWGINLGKFIEYKARILSQPKLIFSNFTIVTNAGRFRTYEPLIRKPIHFQNCFYLYFDNEQENKEILNLNQLKDFDLINLKNSSNWSDIEKDLRKKEIKPQNELGIILLTENTKMKYL